MSILRLIFKNSKKNNSVLLGRWNIDYNKNINDLKIDLANHDSCGGPLCSSPPILFNKKEYKDSKDNNDISDDEIYTYLMSGSFHMDPKN